MLLLIQATLLLHSALAGTCASYGEPKVDGEVEVEDLDESSGLAPSWVRPGLWFSHIDSGGTATLWGFLRDGTPRGVYEVTGASFVDWEDMAAGPCPDGGRCLYIADVGDNKRERPSVTVYAVAEPTADDETLPVIARWEGVYPDGPQNVEALLVHPRTGLITLVTKEVDGLSGVYDMPLEPSSTPTTMTRVAELTLTGDTEFSRLATGGAWDPDGQRVVIRTLSQAFEWDADGCGLVAPWSGTPRVMATPEERQGEAIAYDLLSGDILTTTEGSPTVISSLPCEGYAEADIECGEDSGADSGAHSGADSAPESEVPESEVPESEPLGSEHDDTGCGCGRGCAAGMLLPALGLLRRRPRRY